jgi:hypothetical protein
MNPSRLPTSLDLWLSGLQGRELDPEHGEPADYREGCLLRELFVDRAQSRQADATAQPSPTTESEETHWRAILEKARQDGLFVQPQQPGAAGWWRRLTGSGQGGADIQHKGTTRRAAANQRFYALAAGIAVMAVGLTIVMENMKITPTDDGGEVVFRGDEAAQRIVVPAGQAAALADRIEAVLKQHQLVYRRTNVGPAAIQIQAKVPPGSLARQPLEKLGVSVPEHGRLNILVTQ